MNARADSLPLQRSQQLPTGLLEDLTPGVFGVAQNRPHEIGLFVVGRRRLAGLWVDRRGLLGAHLPGDLPENLHRVLPGQQADRNDDHDPAKPQALAADAHAAAAPGVVARVDDVVTATSFFPEHGGNPL